ncbi:TadE/TadG family type IV pilus assembly protein [Altererythrobacter sp. KTW20L]|uniref:TadE/TadG family type IV pilus assembly protein n=1 Tax=Altererythrobacter sp. KTW20L TaxID=2942210 RepID=UPI0020BD5C45|nr:TadE/TadG family type IV pilus assembly protein [Altererythrobacter sp. KTW20L]
MMRQLFRRLQSQDRGSAMVEFALIAPILLVMVFGVLQAAFAVHNYNALRNLSADAARYAVIAHQSGNNLSTTQIRTFAVNHARGAPYLLSGERVNAVVTTPEVQRIEGAIEMQITVTYQIDSLLAFAGIEMPFITFTRPIFVTDNSIPLPM